MRKLFVSLSLLIVLAAGACAPSAPAVESTVEVVSTAAVETAPTTTSATLPAPPEAGTPVAFESSPPATCTVTSSLVQSDSEEESIFQPVTEEDHMFGATDARVTFIVYSDFQ